MKVITRKIYQATLLFALTFCFVQMVEAQVTIGSLQKPNGNALLDLQETGTTTKGLLLPRVALQSTSSFNPMSAHVQGMAVYNTATVNDVTPGYYYNDGTQWVKLLGSNAVTNEDSFFYMPAVLLPTNTTDPAYNTSTATFTVDLYANYVAQFSFSSPLPTGSNKVASDPTAKLPVHQSNELHYFVTYYDDAVFDDVSISTIGKLSYKLKSGFVYTDKTFMNIVFKVK